MDDIFDWGEWQRYGACHGEDVELFIPNLGGNFNRARKICDGCTVRSECLDFALAGEDLAGMWGGTTAPERRLMRAARGWRSPSRAVHKLSLIRRR